MNNWMGVSYWVFMAAMLRLSYEVEASQNGSGEDQGNYTPIGDSNPFAGHSDGADERMKRFLSFSLLLRNKTTYQ